MGKTVLIVGSDCAPCVRLVTLLEVQRKLDQYELIDVEDDEDMDKLADILEKSPELIEDRSPQCVIRNDNGSYSPCDMDAIWDIAESILKDAPTGK